PGSLDRRQEQGNQHRDDRDDDHQLNQGEPAFAGVTDPSVHRPRATRRVIGLRHPGPTLTRRPLTLAAVDPARQPAHDSSSSIHSWIGCVKDQNRLILNLRVESGKKFFWIPKILGRNYEKRSQGWDLE